MSNYLVIGGTGVISQFVTRQLVALGLRPVVLTSSGNIELIGDAIRDIELVRGDITDGASLARIVAAHAITHIAHLGAIIGHNAEADPVSAVRIGVEGMVNVLEAARLNGVQRVVYTSSKAAYGTIAGRYGHPSYVPLNEDYPTKPHTMYGVVKLAGEHLGATYSARYGLEFLALRFGFTVGPGKLLRHGPFSLHSRMLENAMASKALVIERGGDALEDTVYNADCAHGVVCALLADAPRSAAFNIGTGRGITLHQFADAVREVFPNAKIEIGPGDDFMPAGIPRTFCVMDISRARDELGYAPRFDTVAMVRDYVATMARLGRQPLPS
jgi:UDP-glucose 4-epimerase